MGYQDLVHSIQECEDSRRACRQPEVIQVFVEQEKLLRMQLAETPEQRGKVLEWRMRVERNRAKGRVPVEQAQDRPGRFPPGLHFFFSTPPNGAA